MSWSRVQSPDGGGARRAALAAGAAILALVAAPSGAEAENRLALVIGNGAYAAPQRALPHALNDARDMAASLRRDGFSVVEVQNGAREVMRSALAAFAAKLKPGDVAVFYYAGHGVQGPSSGNRAVNDDFLLPVNADIRSAASIAKEGLSLSEVLSALGGVRTGPELIILDACRDDPAAGAEGSAGLAWPVSSGARSAFIVFAASPGETAGDPPNGEHGVFTGEVLKRIGAPGLSAAALFTQVANAVEQVSDPTQRPYFAGTGAGAGLILNAGAKAEDASEGELATYRQAMDCNKTQCLDFALPRVAEPRLKEALSQRRAVLVRIAAAKVSEPVHGSMNPSRTAAPAPQASERASDRASDQSPVAGSGRAQSGTAASRPKAPRRLGTTAQPREMGKEIVTALVPGRAPPPPPLPDAMPPDVLTFIRAHDLDARGRQEVGRRFLNGGGGFPASWRQARIWLGSAADAGSGAAAYDLGVAYNQGLATRCDRAAANAWFLRAAALGDGDGYVGAAGFVTDQTKSRALLEKGVALGSVDAMIALGEDRQEAETMDAIVTKTRQTPVSMTYYKMAADHGDPNALAKIGECYAAGECGVSKDDGAAARWYALSAARGGDLGQLDLGRAYATGRGVQKDMRRAMGLFERAGFARRFGPVAVARILDKGLGGVPRDQGAAARWYRRAAELGDGYAAMKLADYYDQRSWFNKAATDEARRWWREAAALGFPRFSPQTFFFESQFKKDGL